MLGEPVLHDGIIVHLTGVFMSDDVVESEVANEIDSGLDHLVADHGRVVGDARRTGNPIGRHAQRLRAALMRAVTPSDIEKIAKTLKRAAIDGDVGAAKEILDRLIGKPSQPVEMDVNGNIQAVTIVMDAVRVPKDFALTDAESMVPLRRELPPVYEAPAAGEPAPVEKTGVLASPGV